VSSTWSSPEVWIDDQRPSTCCPGARAGYRYGDNKVVDATAHDTLYCAFDLRGRGDSTDFYCKQRNISREDQDESRR
jgi:hypothetical protein